MSVWKKVFRAVSTSFLGKHGDYSKWRSKLEKQRDERVLIAGK